ncbi:nitrilase-related carbon-nitrogen hydrolase [Methanolobus chelungpuianus]|uniref:Carbon-nitrogen hydrolase n=1 Tax=Methanolobus chelungpuianus TaxID=502115 RepID=A0AAE3KYD2_9EURY|nr:nitrilase-related carbon-nitrogen hydrolase [Methanolobus chelungpuianus]MCQ6962003.1 carbon-nitrogen hydrolase [Methanolobus chelungpuianus]
MTQIRVACIQMDVRLCHKGKNLEKALQMAEQAVLEGAELVVLPEVFSTGFCYGSMETSAETVTGPTISALLAFSGKHDCVMVTSIIERVLPASEDLRGTGYYNLGLCIESGEICGTYRKTHPFSRERQYFSPGDSISPIRLRKRDLIIGLEICYELRFPEVARRLCLAGSDILITVAEFPNPRQHVWRTLAVARSVENQIPHIACNRTGVSGDASFFGGSLIVDASGAITQEAGEEECVLVHDIDTAGTVKVRESITVFKDRREDLY